MKTQSELFYNMLRGDEKSLRLLLDEYHNYLMVVGSRYLTDKMRVEDVVHDVFADLWNKNSNVELKVGVKSFLRGAVINKCLAIVRKDNRIEYTEASEFVIVDSAPNADQLIDRDNLAKNINEIIDDLPNKCREVYKLSRIEGKSHQEISDAMGISKKTIENHMTRALKALKNELKRRELLIIIFILMKITFLLGVNT